MTWNSMGWKKCKLLLTLVVGLLVGCNEPTMTAPSLDGVSPALKEAVTQLGFQTEGMRDVGGYVVVEGDILILKTDLLRTTKRTSAAAGTTGRLRPGPANRQWIVDTIVSQANIANVRVDLAGIASDAGWTAAMRNAMGAWNSLPGTDILFTEGSPADITVQFANLGGGIAQATFPIGSTRKPGPTIYIDPAFSGYQPLQKLYVLAHELGHTIGFRHTNWQGYVCNGHVSEPRYAPGARGANQVHGTPSTEFNSIMNGCSGGTFFNGFSHYDAVAAMHVYNTLTLTESNNGTYPTLTGTYPRGAISATIELETDITMLDDTWTTAYRTRSEIIGPLESGGQLVDNFHPIGFNNCSQLYDWPFEQDRAFYVLRVRYPQGALFIGVNGRALNNPSPGWRCWDD